MEVKAQLSSWLSSGPGSGTGLSCKAGGLGFSQGALVSPLVPTLSFCMVETSCRDQGQELTGQ